MEEKPSKTLKNWYLNQPARLHPYIKNRLAEALNWSQDQIYNKLSGRTEPTKAEQIAINTIFAEEIFAIEVTELKIEN